MKSWKRNAVVATVALFVCVAVYLNWQYNRTDDPSAFIGVNSGQSVGAPSTDTQPLDTAASPVAGQVPDPGAALETVLEDDGHSSYFDSARLARQQARDSATDLLNTAAASKETTQEAKDAASKEYSKLADTVMKEARIEGLVKAKGFIDCVAYIGAEGISIVVATEAGNLNATDVARIKDIVKGETDAAPDKIKVLNAKS